MAPVTRPLPVVTLADLCGNCTELLVLAPHPDDETLACGGVMQAALAAGLAVRVIVVSDGEACFGALPPADRAVLAARRRAESVAAAKALGAAVPGQMQCAREGVLHRPTPGHAEN